MNKTVKHILGTATVLGCVALVMLGNIVRSRVDGVPLVNVVQSTLPVPEQREAQSSLTASLESDPTTVKIPADVFFEQLSAKLKSDFVDPIKDDGKLVAGAIRGMVASLNDPVSQYMDKDQYRAFLEARSGMYEGIGADLLFESSKEDKAIANKQTAANLKPEDLDSVVRIPRLVVAYVVPGGPADKAGVQAGDWVHSIDGQWVVNSDILKQLRKAQLDLQKGREKPERVTELKKKLRALSKNNLMPLRAIDKLTIGTTGSVKVVWNRGNKQIETRLEKATTETPLISESPGGSIRLQLVKDVHKQLMNMIRGRREVTIDLRGNVIGDFEAMKDCMAVLAPSGKYGYLTREHGETLKPLIIEKGNPNPPKLTLLVDSRTQNVAEVMALALSSRGVAKLSGEGTSGDRSITEIVELPDKSAYTLVTAKYSATPPAKPNKSDAVKKAGEVRK